MRRIKNATCDKIHRELEKAGFTKEQAQKSVKIWMEFMDNNFATKADLKELQYVVKFDLNEVEKELKSEIDRLEKKMDAEFSKIDKELVLIRAQFPELENKLVIKLGSMMAASVAILATLITMAK